MCHTVKIRTPTAPLEHPGDRSNRPYNENPRLPHLNLYTFLRFLAYSSQRKTGRRRPVVIEQ